MPVQWCYKHVLELTKDSQQLQRWCSCYCYSPPHRRFTYSTLDEGAGNEAFGIDDVRLSALGTGVQDPCLAMGLSYDSTSHHCQDSTCDDGIQNGDEERADCGGGMCTPFLPCCTSSGRQFGGRWCGLCGCDTGRCRIDCHVDWDPSNAMAWDTNWGSRGSCNQGYAREDCRGDVCTHGGESCV